MSRNPSPAPPAPHPLPLPVLSSRLKQKSFGVGITAGAEDVKYQAKYKELKRKVRDIEADNDKLHIKVMNAKLSIQRMKMERAILYERLALVPPSPPAQDLLPLPTLNLGPAVSPHQPVSGVHHHREIRDHSTSLELDQAFQPYQDYNSRPRVSTRAGGLSDGRTGPALDNPIPSIAPHASILHSPQRVSSEHDGRQHLPPPQQLPPGHQYENPLSHPSAHSPPVHHDYPTTSHSRTRSQSSSRTRSHQLQSQSYRNGPYTESLAAPQQAFSPPLSERERSRRPDMRSVSSSHVDAPSLSHHQSPLAQLSPRIHSAESRSRMHPHQRIGPGTYINREDFQDRHRDLDRDREREWEQERNNRDLGRSRDMSSLHSPHSVHRSRQPMERGDYSDQHMSSREEQAHFYDGPPVRTYPLVSRSGTPGSGSASGSGAGLNEESSRPDSRTQYYDHDRVRNLSYRLRPVTHANQGDDIDFVHEDGRSHSRADRAGGVGNFVLTEQNHPSMESRKRSRNDMDVDSENDVAENTRGASTLYSTGRLQEDRGTKRYHRERQHRRSVDTQPS